MRFHLIIISSLVLFHFSYSTSYISEINFVGSEFIEIYSDEILYFNNSKIFDESTNFNSLSKIKNSSTNYTLFVGSSFLQNNNISNYNCSIYKTDKSQVSNGGLKSKGESLWIQINNSLNLTWLKDEDLDFDVNQSLNYNINDTNYYVSNHTICAQNIIPKIETINETNKTEEIVEPKIKPKKESYIKIKNEDKLIDRETDELEYEIFKGDTKKRSIYFHLNEERIFTTQLSKYEKIEGKLLLGIKEGLNELIINGLEIEKTLKFYEPIKEVIKKLEVLENLTNESKEMPIETIEIKTSNISNEIKSNKEEKLIQETIETKEAIEPESKKEEDIIQENLYVSENEKSKNNSIYYVFVGSISLLSLMLLKW